MTIQMIGDSGNTALRWWAERLRAALSEAGEPARVVWGERNGTGEPIAVTARLLAETDPEPPPGGEGFILTNQGGRVGILARDIPGLCYGLDEVTRHVKDGGALATVAPRTVAPRFAFRAIKFNLPWSCYRTNLSVTIHTDTVKDLSFWDAFLDMMAEHRFNVLTLWNVFPYQFMTRAKSFPLATEMTDAELDVWRAFWNGLFSRCKARCIRPFVMSMNTFVSEGFRRHYDARANNDSIHWGMAYTTPEVEQYLRECVTQIIDEYPDLAGIGTSLGEHMDGMTPAEREAFHGRVYYEAVRQASRPVEILRRAPFSANTGATVTRAAIESANLPPLPHPTWLEIKYNFSHGYSSPQFLAAHGVTRQSAGGAAHVRDLLKGYWEPEPKNYKMALMVRNEDFFVLRWAQPDFVRAHIRENDKAYVGGYFIGSEGIIPAKDYSHHPDHPHMDWRYAFEKNRLFYMIWGRLLFDPDTPDSVFARDIERRHGLGEKWPHAGHALLRAYRHACNMPMALATFHAATWDFSLYSEGFISTRFDARMFTDWGFNGYAPGRSFITLEHLMKCEPLDPDWLSASEYADRVVGRMDGGAKAGRAALPGKVTPLDVADGLDADADRAEEALDAVPVAEGALECEVADIRAWVALSRYLACKLRAAAAMSVYLRNHDPEQRREAVRWLDEPHAKAHWRRLVEITEAHYQEVPLVSLGTQPFHWRLFLDEVDADIRYAEGRHEKRQGDFV